jgi:prephenate dehydrogenase
MLPEALGIIGLGTLGGSVAWRATHIGVKRVVGYCFSPRDGVAAAKSGAISELATDVRRVVTQSEFVVLATTPRRTLNMLDRLSKLTMQGAYITDVAPVKVPIVEKAAQLGLSHWFAGSHPLVGWQDGGFEGARHDRLEAKLVYVTPVPGGENAAREVADFWDRVVGAAPVRLDAETHDRIVAQTSHLPMAVAAILAAALKHRGPKGATYGAGALAATQLVQAEVDLWADVLMMNRMPVLEALNGVEDELGLLRDALTRGDLASLRDWLEEARGWRDGVDA